MLTTIPSLLELSFAAGGHRCDRSLLEMAAVLIMRGWLCAPQIQNRLDSANTAKSGLEAQLAELNAALERERALRPQSVRAIFVLWMTNDR